MLQSANAPTFPRHPDSLQTAHWGRVLRTIVYQRNLQRPVVYTGTGCEALSPSLGYWQQANQPLAAGNQKLNEIPHSILQPA